MGLGPGENSQFSFPQGICTDGKERVLVASYGNKRIQVFSLKGSFIKSFPCSSKPCDVAVDPIGNIHVALSGISIVLLSTLKMEHRLKHIAMVVHSTLVEFILMVKATGLFVIIGVSTLLTLVELWYLLDGFIVHGELQ